MNKQFKPVSVVWRWIVGTAMVSLVFSSLFMLSVSPAHAFQKGAVTATSDQARHAMSKPALASWKVVKSPNVRASGDILYGVAAVSASDGWAVGEYASASSNGDQTLTLHWNGSSWSLVKSPNVGASYNYLRGVAAVSVSDVWAVGYSQKNTSPYNEQALIEHWNGHSWSIVKSPNATTSNVLSGVAVVSANDVWAVGSVIEHWNGTSWSLVNKPMGGLYAVAAVSASDVWAVGAYDNTSTGLIQTFSEHWNGSSWRVVKSPNPVGASHDELDGVTAVSASDVWAVGYYYDPSAHTHRTLIEHWNGSTWSIVSSPNVSRSDNYLSGVAVVSAADIWAVGKSSPHRTYSYQTLIEHWNGSSWSIVSSPNPGSYYDSLSAVAVVSATDVWAVGDYLNESNGNLQTLTEHYS